MPKTNPWEKIERERRWDVILAHKIVADPGPYVEIQREWARRVIDNEAKEKARAPAKPL